MQSMTGYGTSTGHVGQGRLYLELKTINHRYCDITLRIPGRMGALEARVKEILQRRFDRGKVELFIREVEPIFGGAQLVVNVELARQYQKSLKQLQQSLGVVSKSDFLSLVGLSPFIQSREKEGNYLKYWRAIQRLLDQASAHVDKMRAAEGAHLLKDQKLRLKNMDHFLHHIEARAKENTKQRRSNLAAGAVNGNMDITEELIRLKSHTKQYASLLSAKDPVGRKLDFLIQEMHREVNTIGAKAADASISSAVVEVKALLENLREQVQNIV